MDSDVRLPRLVPGDLDEQQRRLYERIAGSPRVASRATPLTDGAGGLHGPFNAMLYQPGIGEVVHALGAALRHTAFSQRTTETVVLEVARLLESDYEWYAHEGSALRGGMTPDEIAALRAGLDHPTFSDEERTARRVANALITQEDLADDLFAVGVACLGKPGLVTLVTLVGYYRMLATTLRVFRVPLPAGAERPFPAGDQRGEDPDGQ